MSEMWNLPWHALQRNLALGLSSDAVGHFVPAFKALQVQGAAVSANTWLSRALGRTAPPLQARP